MENCKQLTNCLCCDGENLRTILDLGNQSPANNYNVTDKFPLRLNVCLDCSHAQLSHAVNPDILFKDYPYMSGVSETMKAHYKWFAERVNTTGAKTVYEIACNDGAQLDAFRDLGFETFGIDPAKNLHQSTVAKGHNVICGYFPQHASKLQYDVVVAQNVFAHVSNPGKFLEGCKKLMHDESLLFIQTSQAKMLENYQCDTIYHEHISFFNRRSIGKLISRNDFEIVSYEFLADIHGGSDLYCLRKLPEISIRDYSDFSNRCYKFAEEFRLKVEGLQKEGNYIVCYGAAAKMINLIRFTGIKPTGIIDDTPTKIGQKIDGQFRVFPFSDLENSASNAIIPVWNFFEEIKNKVETAHPGKFKFLKYTPVIELE